MSDRVEAAIRELADAPRAEIAAVSTVGPDRLLSIDDTATAMSISRSLLLAEIGAGRLRSVKVGRRRLIPQSAIDEYGR